MSNTVTIKGDLTAGPQSSCDSGFPAGLLQISFGLVGGCPGTKAAPVQTYHVKTINSPLAFAVLDGVGPGESVTQGNTIYIRTQAAFDFRFTTDDGVGGSVVAVMPQMGLMIYEFPASKFLKLLEAKGVGTIEYYVSGNS